MTVLVVGNTTLDVIDGTARRAGGAPRYAAEALAWLDHRAVVVTGAAAADAELVAAARYGRVEVVQRPIPETPVFRLDHSGGTRALAIERLGTPWTTHDVEEWVNPHASGQCWIQVGALSRADFDAGALLALAGLGHVGLDGQGLARPGLPGAVRLDADYDRQCLEALTVLKLAEDEAAALGGLDTLAALGVPELLLTLGERGSLVTVAGVTVAVTAVPVPDADTTGSGDRFLAAYLAGRDAGRPPVEAARLATQVVHDLLAAGR